MAPLRRAARLADDFDESYPESLPLRLAWLADHLRIDRARLLRLMGLVPDEVGNTLHASWETIAQRWEDQAWWIEELLRQLIAFFGYDWKALADRLHQPTEVGTRLVPECVSRPAGHVERLQTVPPGRREQTLLARISEGGPDVLMALLEYLSPENGIPMISKT